MITNPALQRIIHQTLYQLKLTYGVVCDIYRMNSSETTYETGVIAESRSKITIRRGIKLPSKVSRLSYISPNFTQTNKPFITKGLGWDEVTDVFIFDGRDLRDFDPQIEDWIVYNHTKFNFRVVEELGHKAGWVIGCSQARGELLKEIYSVHAFNYLEVQDDVQ